MKLVENILDFTRRIFYIKDRAFRGMAQSG